MHQYVIIVAGGIGSRMKSERPKQFLELAGEPVIIRTIRCFIAYNPDIRFIICVHRNYRNHLENLLDKFGLARTMFTITFGGETRLASVRNGLAMIDDRQAIVGIHDSARPLVSVQTIKNSFETAAIKGNAVPCVPIAESLRKISNNINNSVNRHEYRIVQTPQCFQAGLIKDAFASVQGGSFTDDASVVEHAGTPINLVEGNEENIKITSPKDLIIAAALLKNG
jgi:2-C-methyl-D-erythritol 4-phosphate cytidylyltransferase